MRTSLVAFAGVLLLALTSLGGSCDPVHSDEVDALGGEAPGVRTGPLHRPGQTCTSCHDGKLGDPPQFSVAGTIFQNATDKQAAADARVLLTGADGATHATTTNAAGNFYLSPNEFSPVFPMKVEVTWNGIQVKMISEVGRDASCAKCHTDPAGPTSAGHIFIPADGLGP